MIFYDCNVGLIVLHHSDKRETGVACDFRPNGFSIQQKDRIVICR